MTDYNLIILLTLVGFLALAAVLLVPVYRFLRREEEASDEWTIRELRRREDLAGPDRLPAEPEYESERDPDRPADDLG